MRSSTALENDAVLTFGASESLGLIGGILCAFEGALLGFLITGPLAAFGMIPNQDRIVENLLISLGFLGAGIIGGALVGGAIGWAMGASLGYAIDRFR